MSYVQVPREQFMAAMTAAGFQVDEEQRGELAVIRQHHLDPTMFVKIFTSMPLAGGDARARGADAIRVVLIFKNPHSGRSGGLWTSPRVLRTGSIEAVIQRTLQRAREAYAEGNRRASQGRRHVQDQRKEAPLSVNGQERRA